LRHLSHAPRLVRLGHGEGCAPIAHAPDLSHPPAASFVQRGAAHPLVFARGSPAHFARHLGPPFCAPPPFAHPPILHKGGHEGGGTHPPPVRAPCTHSPFAHKGANGARVCPPPTLCMRPTEHAEKGGGHACNGGEGAQGRRLRGCTNGRGRVQGRGSNGARTETGGTCAPVL